MMDHMSNSDISPLEGNTDMRHLTKPRGIGYSSRMVPPVILIGTKNPWTGRPFGKEIKLGLGTRVHAEALRQRDVCLARVKAAGVYKGRKPSIDVDEVKRLRDVEGLGATEIARKLGIARTSVYRVLQES